MAIILEKVKNEAVLSNCRLIHIDSFDINSFFSVSGQKNQQLQDRGKSQVTATIWLFIYYLGT